MVKSLPSQQLAFSRKTKEWRKKNVDFADSRSFFNYSLVRRSVVHKKVNYDLINGRLHMNDMQSVLNPDNIQAGYIPDKIPHYPILNSKLNVLRGEESKRVFDYRVVITNPNAISQIEKDKQDQLFGELQKTIADTAQSEEEFQEKVQDLNEYFSYDWQDLREIRANALLNHYVKEYNVPLLFNQGFMDAMTVAEEIYQCSIVGGEPIIEKLNPLKVRVFRSGYSNKIEDADMIIIEDFWSPGKIIDTFYDQLKDKDIKYLENALSYPGNAVEADTQNIDERANFVLGDVFDATGNAESFLNPYSMLDSSFNGSNTFVDTHGNVRVLRVYWKSRRKIKKVKSYDPYTGEEVYNFYPEDYKINKNAGEEEQIFWINEAWEGNKIGRDIYLNMRPCVVQYNRLSNPSKCHFGIVGSIYNLNDSKPFSMVDMMKPYNYLYNAIHDRLNKAIAANWGKIMRLDLAKVPKGWSIDKWLYYAKVNHIAIEDSFNEGSIGAARGKLVGGFSQGGTNVIDAETGNYIQQHTNLLEFIKMEMSEVAGISKQREGQISNRETVGGVERATLQSSHITEWLFAVHDDVKKRALECFLETAKAALKGRKKKFQYIMSDMSIKVIDIDGDEFAESDYGLVIDTSHQTQDLNNKLESLAHAALQNQTLTFSTIMKLYGSSSLAEKQRFVEKDEKAMMERAQQNQDAQNEVAQQIAAQEAEVKMQELKARDQMNVRDNETKILIAQMNNLASTEELDDTDHDEGAKEKLLEDMRQFNERLALDKEKLDLDKKKHQDDVKLKTKQINKSSQKSQSK